MSNTLLTIDMITQEALVVLENELTFTRNINRQYDDQFGKAGAKIGSTLNIRKPVQYTVRRTPTLVVQATTEQYVPLTLDTQYGVDMAFTSAEMKLSLDDFSDRIIKPAVATMANAIDYDGLQEYVNVYQSVGSPGSVPSTLATFLASKTMLDNAACPTNDRKMVLSPETEASIVNALTTLFNPNKQISDQYLKGSMGNAIGFDWYMDQNVAVHTVGTYAANVAGNAVTVTTTVTSGGSSVVTGGWTAADFLNIGDIIYFANTYYVNPQNRQSTGELAQFVVTSLATADGGGAMTINFSPAVQFSGQYQNVTSATGTIPNTTVVKVVGASATVTPQNLAFQRDAFTFATVYLPALPGVVTSTATSKQLGMSIRLTQGTDLINDTAISRLDLLGGWATIRPSLACRIAS